MTKRFLPARFAFRPAARVVVRGAGADGEADSGMSGKVFGALAGGVVLGGAIGFMMGSSYASSAPASNRSGSGSWVSDPYYRKERGA
jgi:hypothetical protein